MNGPVLVTGAGGNVGSAVVRSLLERGTEVRAAGTEPFETMKDGAAAIEYPEAGEVVWADDRGVTCRRWNWRQGVRTRLSVECGQMWFILESLPSMPLAALHQAGDRLIEGLLQMMPQARIERTLIGEPGGA